MADRTGKNVASGRTWDLIGPIVLGPGIGYGRKPSDPIILTGLTLGDLNLPGEGEITRGFHHALSLETGWRRLPFSIDQYVSSLFFDCPSANFQIPVPTPNSPGFSFPASRPSARWSPREPNTAYSIANLPLIQRRREFLFPTLPSIFLMDLLPLQGPLVNYIPLFQWLQVVFPGRGKKDIPVPERGDANRLEPVPPEQLRVR
jgi:hypothetical protein